MIFHRKTAMTDMLQAHIDGLPVEVPAGSSILDAARAAGVHVPTLCAHPDLPPTAACGICVVRIEGAPNLVRACSTPLRNGMKIVTLDPEIVQVRRTVLELILSAHPNECLTCGRNGTCELQRLADHFGMRSAELTPLVQDLPRDQSTRTIVLEPRKCIKCGRCLTVCQEKQNVWALSMLERGLDTRISPAGDIELADSPCVRCGQCSAHCPVGAIYEYDETAKVWAALNDPNLHCVVQIAPAVRVSLGEAFGYPPGTNLTGQIYAVLRRLGFKTVFDTNFGADVTIIEESSEFIARLTSGAGALPLITSCCPAWVDFMEKFHGDMIAHFSSCKSPHAIVGSLTKTYYAEKMGLDPDRIFMVSIMPCTAKKHEIVRSESMYASGRQDVDVSLTTREFSRMIRQTGIDLRSLPADSAADSLLGEYSGAGTIFGFSGGVMEAALRTAHCRLTGDEASAPEFPALRGLDGVKRLEVEVAGKKLRVAAAHGLGHVEELLAEVRRAREAGGDPAYHFIEVMACPGGCVGGGGQAWRISDEIRRARAAGLQADDRAKPARRSDANPQVKQLYAEFLGEPLGHKAHELLHTAYQSLPRYRR